MTVTPAMSRRKKGRSAVENRQLPAPPEPKPLRPSKPFLVVASLLLVGWCVFLLVLAFGGW